MLLPTMDTASRAAGRGRGGQPARAGCARDRTNDVCSGGRAGGGAAGRTAGGGVARPTRPRWPPNCAPWPATRRPTCGGRRWCGGCIAAWIPPESKAPGRGAGVGRREAAGRSSETGPCRPVLMLDMWIVFRGPGADESHAGCMTSASAFPRRNRIPCGVTALTVPHWCEQHDGKSPVMQYESAPSTGSCVQGDSRRRVQWEMPGGPRAAPRQDP